MYDNVLLIVFQLVRNRFANVFHSHFNVFLILAKNVFYIYSYLLQGLEQCYIWAPRPGPAWELWPNAGHIMHWAQGAIFLRFRDVSPAESYLVIFVISCVVLLLTGAEDVATGY